MNGLPRIACVSAWLSCALASPARAEPPYVPAPAAQVSTYFPEVLPCRVVRPEDQGATAPMPEVKCKHHELEERTLRELSILRNTIYARYGWDGYRKEWLKAYFHAQPWFKP